MPLRPASGVPLERGLRASFEPLLGRDLSDVRIRSDSAADGEARQLGARAFVTGSEIAFASGRFNPRTARGRWLLAHELAHVAQPQDSVSNPLAPQISPEPAESTVEVEARNVADALVAGHRVRPAHRRRAGAVHRFGEPENVPDRTYVTTQGAPGFLEDAVAYHTLWGLAPTRISSVEAILSDLATGQGHLGRVRIVMHAADIGIYSSLFAGEPRYSLEKDRLSAWAESDATGLAADLGNPFSVNATTKNAIVADLRGRNATLLTPFQSGAAAAALDELVDRVAQRVLLRGVRTRRNRSQIDTLAASTDLLLGAIRTRVALHGQVTESDARTLQTELEASAQNTGLHATAAPPADDDLLRRLTQANRAVSHGFRQTLGGARARFDATSFIDIRGCRAGEDPEYLHAFSRFFGQSDALPHVSAPDWYQMFPRLGWQGLNPADIPARMSDPAFSAALDRWLDVTRARLSLQALRSYYRFEIARRTQLAERRTQTGTGNAPGPHGSLSLQLPRLTGPDSSLPMPAADGLIISLLSVPDRLPSLTPPALLAPHGPTPRLPQTAPGSGHGSALHLTDPLVTIVQHALDRLQAADAEARFYFDSALPLPVQSGRDVRLFMLQSLHGAVMTNWVSSQWATRAPGLTAVLRAPMQSQLRTQALVSSHEPDADMLFPPDPLYWQHIKSI